MRLLRATLDSMTATDAAKSEARKMRGKAPAVPPPPPPPSASAVAAFTSSHALSEDRQRCLKCFCSATKATMKEWWSTPCPELYNVDGVIKSPKVGERIHIAGA